MPKLLFIITFLGAFVCNSAAQHAARFLHYSVKDGLSQNSVHAIYRDHTGLVWIGTQDGLNSFDGKNFTVYRHDDNDTSTISDQFVVNIKEDSKGFLWIGTRNGFNRLNRHTGKFTRYYTSEEDKHVFQAAYSDYFLQNDGKAVVVQSKFVVVIDTESRHFTKIYGPGSEDAAWFILPDYSAWVINTAGAFFYTEDLRKGKFSGRGHAPFSASPTLGSIIAGVPGAGLIYIYSKTQPNLIFRFNIKENKWEDALPVAVPVIHLNVSNAGELYISSLRGIVKVSPQAKEIMIANEPGNNNSLPPGNVLCTFTDKEGNLWAGTAGNGLAVNNRSFENYLLLKTPVQNDVVTAVVRTSAVTYIGTRSGLYKTNNNKINEEGTVAYTTLFTGKSVTALTADNAGNIWAGIQSEGICILNRSGKIIKQLSPANSQLKSTSIMHLEKDKKGRVLISSTNGFYIASSPDSALISFGPNELHKTAGNYIMSSFAAGNGSIWVSNNGGLNVFNEALRPVLSLQSFDDKSSFLKRTIVTSVAHDSSGAAWIGTIRDGLYKYHKNSAVHYNSSSGLSSDVVYNIVCDNKNRIWVTTSAGLNIFDAAHNCFTALSAADGIPNAAFVFGAAQKDEEGNILFGTSEGLLICNANKTVLHQSTIRAFVEDVRINGSSISFTENSLTIIPDDKVINFTFASTPAFFSGNIIYQYRLAGQSNEWITLPQGVHMISYTGLPYKKLVLQVRAATAAGNLPAAEIYAVAIYSKPPFYKTTGFIIAAAVLLLSFIVLMIMEYNKRSYKKQLNLLRIEKELQSERVRIGRDLHDNIGAYTSALIAGLNHINSTDAAQAGQIADLKDYGVNIMGFLRETIWMLNTETLTITAFADRLKNYALRIGKNYPGTDLQITEEIINDKTLQPTIMLNLFRILQEALQNAYKHAEAGKISINISSNEALCFSVVDNGKGFSGEARSDGYGLKNMQQRAEDCGFILHIISAEKGTTVSLTENTANVPLPAGVKTL